MANAASAPSAAATITHCTARDASPATKRPGRCVFSYLPVRDRTLVVQLATEMDRKLGLLELAGREEQRPARQRVRAVRSTTRSRMPSRALQRRHPLLADARCRFAPAAPVPPHRSRTGRRCTARDRRSMPSVRATAQGRGSRGRRWRSADRALPSRRSTGQWNTLCPYSSLNPSISGTLSTTPVAISSLREKTTLASSSTTLNRPPGTHSAAAAPIDVATRRCRTSRAHAGRCRGIRAAACRRASGSHSRRARLRSVACRYRK